MATPPIKVKLSKLQQAELNKILAIDKRGEFVARIYLQKKFGDKADFKCEKIPGADISVILNGIVTPYEVKATKDKNIALSKLKVSSKRSHDLISGGAIVLRVMCADTPAPCISELQHGVDFKLKKEPRWRAEKP